MVFRLFALLLLATASADKDLRNLKQKFSQLSASELLEHFGAVETRGPAPSHQDKIDHFVVLFMENRAFDHLFGCQDRPGIDGIPKGGRDIPIDPANPTKGSVHVSCGTAKLVCDPGPSIGSPWQGFWGQHFSPACAKNASHLPYGGPACQSDKFSVSGGGLKQGVTVEMFAPEQLPVKTKLIEEFGLFNKYFTSTPTSSTPNHLFAQSATSCGQTRNALFSTCGGATETYPQPTIYDAMKINNVSFSLYMNNTREPNWPGSYCKKCTTPTEIPDIIMQGVARHKDRFQNYTDFYDRTAAGTLPSVSWLMPPGPMMDHPCHDMALGERLHKDIYEALRAGLAWNKTLFVIVYDDGGDFYDHVVSPFEGVPADDAGCHVAGGGCEDHFDFRRLGPRGSALAISPMIPKGVVFQEPLGPTNTSQWEHSSISATITNLFNLSRDEDWALGPVPGFLTQRDAWAGSFHELLTLDAPRTDCPMHLPTPPVPATPFPDSNCGDLSNCGSNATLGNLTACTACIEQYRPSLMQAGCPASTLATYCKRERPFEKGFELKDDGLATTVPQHCGSVKGAPRKCFGGGVEADSKQRNKIELLSRLTRTPEPDMDVLSWDVANAWMASRWHEWLGPMGGPIH